MKKESVLSLVLLMLIPLVVVLGGILAVLINPEIAASHPDYVRNYHWLSLLKGLIFWTSIACACVLWMLACLLTIRSKKRSYLWLFLALLGPLGFAVLATLDDREPAKTDLYAAFLRRMNWPMRIVYELCIFTGVWVVAYEAMVLKRTLMILYESETTGVSVAKIVDIQNSSSGMWAFSEGTEVMFLVILFYMLRPFIFSIVGRAMAMMTTHKAG